MSQRACIITGAANGIGKATVALCLSEGWKVAAVDVDEENLDKLNEYTTEFPSQLVTIAGNLQNPYFCEKVISIALNAYERLDCIINNAASMARGTLESSNVEMFDEVFAINCRAPLLLIKAGLPFLKQSKQATVINIGSVNAYCGEPQLLIYSMSKAALATMTRNLANAYATESIRFNQINVGWVLTEREYYRKIEDGFSEDWPKHLNQESAPVGRLLTPEEVALCIVFLMSEASSLMNGSVIDLTQRPVCGRPSKR